MKGRRVNRALKASRVRKVLLDRLDRKAQTVSKALPEQTARQGLKVQRVTRAQQDQQDQQVRLDRQDRQGRRVLREHKVPPGQKALRVPSTREASVSPSSRSLTRPGRSCFKI